METKACTKCKEVKEISAFFKDKRNTGPKGKGVTAICKVCAQKKKRQWYDDNSKKFQQYNKSYYRVNKTRQKVRKYGLTVEEYEAMLTAQGGVCVICKKPSSDGRALAVDHDHKTGKVRSLLCNNCNNGLGRFQDDPTLLEQAAAYLRFYCKLLW